MPFTQDEVCREALRHRSALVAYAFARLRAWDQAEDAVQDALVVLLGKWADCQSLEGVRPWAFAIVRNTVRERWRAGQRERSVQGAALEALAGACVEAQLEHDGSLLQAARVRALQACLQAIPGRKREMLEGYYHQRQSCEELAGLLGSSANAVAQALSRLRRALQRCAQQRLREEGLA